MFVCAISRLIEPFISTSRVLIPITETFCKIDSIVNCQNGDDFAFALLNPLSSGCSSNRVTI